MICDPKLGDGWKWRSRKDIHRDQSQKSEKVHYLVVGSVGNEQWRHSTYGTKIMKAVELREAGASIAIVVRITGRGCCLVELA